MPPGGIVLPDGRLSDAAVELLHAVCGVGKDLLHAARIRPSSANWLHAPWYPYRRGGALTVGRTIWFTRIWFAPDGLGDGSAASCRAWLLHLAHEAGHLPQAEHFGRTFWGKARYVAAFATGYLTRAVLLRKDIHDTRMEREAEAGRTVLMKLLTESDAEKHPVIAAMQRHDILAVRAWCSGQRPAIASLREAYHAENFA